MMEITARKHSQDPVQEQLREHKAEWNQSVSAFIKALIILKKSINGRPVPELSIGKGDIKFPLPSAVPSLLDRLSSEYEQISSGGKSIIQEQEQYSQMRNQPKQLAAGYEAEMIKEGSSALSRFWTAVSTPFRFDDKDRWARRNMLKAAVELQTKLGEIGKKVLSSDEKAIPEAVHSLKSVFYTMKTGVVDPFKALVELKKSQQEQPAEGESNEQAEGEQAGGEGKRVEDFDLPKFKPTQENSGGVLPVSSEEQPVGLSEEDVLRLDDINKWDNEVSKSIVPALEQIKFSIAKSSASDEDKNLIYTLMQQAERYITEFGIAVSKREDYNKIYELYLEIKQKYVEVFHMAARAKIISLGGAEVELEKFAQARLSRWLSRQRVKLFKDENYRMRLEADEAISGALKDVDTFMDELQTPHADLERVAVALANFSVKLGRVMSVLAVLGDNYNSMAKIGKMRARSEGKGRLDDYSLINITDLNKLNAFAEELGGLEKFVAKEEPKEGSKEEPKEKYIKEKTKELKDWELAKKLTKMEKEKESLRRPVEPESKKDNSGFKDIRKEPSGAFSIPKDKFYALVRSGALVQPASDRVQKSDKVLPSGFEFIEDGVTYSVELIGRRIMLKPIGKNV